MLFNLNSFLISVSTALDMSEKELIGVDLHHSKRVAYTSLRIAQILNLSKEECFDICALAILHDNGITEAVLKNNKEVDNNDFFQLETIIEHCSLGENNVKNFPFFTNTKNVILYHHENYDGSGFFGKKTNDIPLMAQIISFADTLDFNFKMDDDSLHNRENIDNFVQKHVGKLHSKKIANAYFQLSNLRAFWLDQQNLTLTSAINEYLPTMDIDITLENLLEITKVFSKIIDAKSKFTYRHTSGLIEKAQEMAHFYKFNTEKALKFKIAASLHDLGKLAIPNSILEKNAPLDKDEFDTIKKHTYFTHHMLCNIDGFNEIDKWAFSHHEKLDGSGYPFGLSENELCFESRLMACLDIYQALTEDRPYREGLEHKEVMKILKRMVKNNYIDGKIVEDIDHFFE